MKKLNFKSFLLLFFSMTWVLSFGQIQNNNDLFIDFKETPIKNSTYLKFVEEESLVNNPRVMNKTKRGYKLNNEEETRMINKLNNKFNIKGEYKKLVVSNNGKHFACVTNEHGGYEVGVYFFDSNLNLLNTYMFKNNNATISVDPQFNNDGTFFYYGNDEGEFYFFKSDGILYKKGDLHKILDTKQNIAFPIYRLNISKKGDLFHVETLDEKNYIFSKDLKIISSFKYYINSSYFSNQSNLIYLTSMKELFIYDKKNFILKDKITFSNPIFLDGKYLSHKSNEQKKLKEYELK